MRFIGKIFCVVLLICTGTAFTLKAESLEFIYEHYSSNDGLPHNSISDIHQDSRGYMWFCTWYGLSRYDGNGFVNYMMQPDIAANNAEYNYYMCVNAAAQDYLSSQFVNDPVMNVPAELLKDAEFILNIGDAATLYTEIYTAFKLQ